MNYGLCRARSLCILALAWVLGFPAISIAGTESADQAPPAVSDPHLPLAPFRESVLMLAGDSERPVTLEVTLLTPYGQGPFPLAVMNHGATAASANNRGERYRLSLPGFYFLSRGYAVALPMMRGFAESGGELLQEGCDLASAAELNGRDIRAVIQTISLQQNIDRTRIIVAGQSFGAWNTLGLGVAPPNGVRGLVSFNATMRPSDCHDQDQSLVTAAGKLGAGTSIPSLWFYGDNDLLMPVGVWRDVFNRYTRSGGRTELVDVGKFGEDSHQLLSQNESIPLWVPKVDAFLARIGMPSTPVYPEFLPHPAPLATHWAQLSDTSAIPFIHRKGLAAYRSFLDAPKHRAFAIASSGSYSVSGGGYDPMGRALSGCAKHGVDCKLYAVDDNVVWSALPRQAPSEVACPVASPLDYLPCTTLNEPEIVTVHEKAKPTSDP